MIKPAILKRSLAVFGPKFVLTLISIFSLRSALIADERPNIGLIFSDDQRFNYVVCYGSEIPTPHIDRLAKEGIAFRFRQSSGSMGLMVPGFNESHSPVW